MIAAVIVLYYPEIECLKKNIAAVMPQVDYVILVNNSPEILVDNIMKEYNKDKYSIILNSKNLGIAKAINQGILLANKKGCKWLLTLDQDSICPSDLISVYKKYIEIEKVAIVCCAINYNDLEIENADGVKFEYVKDCITSAALINVSISIALGGMDEKMFIDQVDFEFCYRIKQQGYKIVKTNEVILKHNLGNLHLVRIGNIVIHVGNHSSFRKYYMARNLIYMARKHPKMHPRCYYVYRICALIAKTFLFEEQKKEKIVAILEGIKAGRECELYDCNLEMK